MSLTKILAKNLRVLRDLRGRVGQLELANRIGVSRRTIARLESAEIADPGVAQVRALAETLRVPIELLIERSLVPVVVPLPAEVRERLEGPEAAELLRRFVQAADEFTPRQ